MNDLEFPFDQMAHLYNIAINFLMFLYDYHYILLNYSLASQLQSIFYVAYVVPKWHQIFKYYSFISFICSFCSIIICFSSNCYSSPNKYVCITIIIKNLPYHLSFKVNLIIFVISSIRFILYFQPDFLF